MPFRQPTTPRQYRPWHGWLLLIMLLTAVALGMVRKLKGDEPPTADVPAVEWEVEEERNEDVAAVEEPATEEPSAPSLPTTYNLAVPFTSQAPTGVWDALHEDACEESSIFMVEQYFAGAGDVALDATTADAALTAMVQFAESELGHGLSIPAAEVATLVEAYYDGYTADVIENPSVDDIKRLLVEGYPVIVPAAGRALGNPFFTGEGPLYHMLVIRGYDATRFITNDPGTRHGRNYAYTYDVLLHAMGDWNDGDPANGAKRIVVVRPE